MYYHLHFDLSEIIAFARYCPITPACPVTSKTFQLSIQYSTIEAVSQVINRYAAVNYNMLLTAPRHLAIFKTIAKESGLLFTIYTAAA